MFLKNVLDKISKMRAREMVQQLRADLTLAEDPGSVTSIYIAAESYFYRQII